MNPFTWFDRFIDRVIGVPALDGSQWLADVEADHDCLLPDDLWAAHHRHTDTPGDSPEPDVVSVWPADAVTPVQAGGVGGFPNELLTTLVDVLLTWGCRAPHGVSKAIEEEVVKRFVLIRR